MICFTGDGFQGRIVPPRQKGPDAFGWDPIFEPENSTETHQTLHSLLCFHFSEINPHTKRAFAFYARVESVRYAEMPKEKKDAISHRGRALAKLLAYVQTLPREST